MKREARIASFRDTCEELRQEPLRTMTEQSAASGLVFKENFTSHKLHRVYRTIIEVGEETPWEAARRNHGHGRIAVLNDANPHFPGGGVAQGAMDREAYLCRSSNLHACLEEERVFGEFYEYHRTKTDYNFSDRLIYSRDVTVFKDDQPIPQLLPVQAWFRVDVISCAAPYLAKRRYTNSCVLQKILESRFRNVLEAALENEVQILILGAFGCGSFRNPPEVVAKAFRSVLEEARYGAAFARVVFAIPRLTSGGPVRNEMDLRAFQKVFCCDVGDEEKAAAVGVGESIGLPGGRYLESEEERETFRRWQRDNPWFGKQFSILGDDISTLVGFHPRGNPVFYSGAVSDTTGIQDRNDTWWGKVLDFLGGELLVNHAWAGSRVTRPEHADDSILWGPTDHQIRRLQEMGISPDVILVFLGMNDLAVGAPLEPAGEISVHTADTSFSLAYGILLHKLRRSYPQAEIVCCTLPVIMEHGKTADERIFQAYNRHIRSSALAHGCRLVELQEQEMVCYSLDGIHPTSAGMDTLAAAVVRQLVDNRGAAFLGSPRELPAKLMLKFGAEGIRTAEGRTLLLGRSRDCDLVVDNAYVARSQAIFHRREEGWTIQDCTSRNGTYLNGTLLAPEREYPLTPGDRINFARKVEVEFLG